MTRIAHRVSSAAVSHSRNPGPPEKDQLRAPENHRPHPAQGGRAQTPDHEEAVVPLLPGEAASVSGDPQPLPGGPAMWRSPLSIIHGVRYADHGMKSSEARGTPHPPKTWPRQPLEPDLTERAVLEHRMERHFPRSLPTEGLRGQRVLFFRQGTRENSAGTGEARRGPRTAAPGPRSGLSLRVSVRVSDGRGQFVASRRLRAAGGSDHTPAPVRPESLAALHLFWNVPSSSLAPGPSGQRGVATWVSGCCEASVGPRGGERDRGQQWEGRARAPGHSGTLQASSWPPRASRAVENRGSAWHTLVTEQRPCASLQCIS